MYRFFRDRQPAGPELILLPLLSGLMGEDQAERLVSYYFHEYSSTEGDLLLSGDEVMSLVGIGPGPELGKKMEQLREAECVGLVTTVEEAREFILKNRLTKQESMG
jgi:poly(A) polymerase